MSGSSTDINKTKIVEQISTTFKNSAIREVLKTNTKTKIADEAVELVAELAKAMTVEAALRAAKQAKSENATAVTLEHAESILTQMVLDFP